MITRLALIVFVIFTALFSHPARAEEETFGDIAHFLKALNVALESKRSGVETAWENPSTGNFGIVTPLPAFTTDAGQICRRYERTWVSVSVRTAYKGAACRESRGVWKIRDEQQTSRTSVSGAQPSPASRGLSLSDRQRGATRELINALEELDLAVTAKINHDVKTIAQAFSDAYDIERSRRIADFVILPLTFIEQAIGLFSSYKSAPEIVASLTQAEGVLQVASILMGIGQLSEAAGKFQLAMDGPTYSSITESMLREAATSSDPGEYAATVKLHLYGIGGRRSPVWARHRAGERTEMVWGVRAAKRRISEQIAQLVQELSEQHPAADAPAEDILAHVAKVTTAVKRSWAGNVAAPLGAPTAPESTPAAALELGSIAALEQVYRHAVDSYDSDMRMEQSLVLTNAIKAGVQVVTLKVGYKSPSGKLLAQAHREVLTPVSVFQTALTRVYSTTARQQVNGLPHEMLLALPAELSNTWMIVDGVLNHVRTHLRRPSDIASTQGIGVPDPSVSLSGLRPSVIPEPPKTPSASTAQTFAPASYDAEVKRVIENSFNSSVLTVDLGQYEILHGLTTARPDPRRRVIDNAGLNRLKAFEALGYIRIRTVRDRTKKFSGWSDWMKLTQQGSAMTITVKPTRKGNALIPMGQNTIYIPVGTFRISRIVRNEPIVLGAKEVRLVMALYDADWNPDYVEFIHMTTGKQHSDKRKTRVLLSYDYFTSQWKFMAYDNANEADEFASDSVGRALRAGGGPR